MNSLYRLMAVFCTIILFTGSGLASAVCEQSHAKGTWRIHGVVWAVNGNDETEAFKCKLKIVSSGAISSSKSACKVFTGDKVKVTGGKLFIASNCTISGKIKTAEGTVKVRSGQMDRSRKSFTLVGEDQLDANFEYFINGIKQ